MLNADGPTEIANSPLLGTQISTIIFPLIPPEAKQQLPNQPEIEFVHNHNLGNFSFLVQKSPAGFNVTIRPLLSDNGGGQADVVQDSNNSAVTDNSNGAFESQNQSLSDFPGANKANYEASIEIEADQDSHVETVSVYDQEFTTTFSDTASYDPPAQPKVDVSAYEAPKSNGSATANEQWNQQPAVTFEPLYETNDYSSPSNQSATFSDQFGSQMQARMDALFRQMAEAGASDLHMSVSVPPMIRKDGRMAVLDCGETALTPVVIKELLTSIMPVKNQEEFERRNDTDFAYEIPGLARFRANIFADRKGMGGVFRIIPSEILTAEQLGLSKAIMDLCALSKGLVVVTGPTGSGKSTTLCAMVDSINKTREDHIITIEDPIEFTHENQKCLVNQREVHNHTDSFKNALRAALREDPDILLVGEMRDLETISIAIETAETGHLVFGTLHTTTAPSTVDRIIDQFPADRQQQVRVMLSESLRGVIAQTLLPKKGGGRIAALEILIITPAISNLIREGKTFQIPSSMQTGKVHGMVMLNDALIDLVKKDLVEPRDAYIKAVDKPGFEALLKREGLKI